MGPVNATEVVRKPPGGVVRNYQCLWKATNVKTVIRPETVHPSLFGGVHFFCYNKGFIKKTLHSYHNPVIYHYKSQAWEVTMRKYKRRASPASKPFLYTNISIDAPADKWVREIGFCRKQQPLMFDHVRCALSQKWVGLNCSSGAVAQLLITGSGGLGSGMGWTWAQLRKSLEDFPQAASSTSVDWTSGLIRPISSSLDPNPELRFRYIFHQTREPLAAITAITTISKPDWATVRKVSGFDARRYTDPVHRALHFWVIWNQLLETISDWTFQVESASFEEICKRAELLPDCSEGSPFERGADGTPIPQGAQEVLQWADLMRVDPNITLVARGMAARYGYL